MKWIKWLVIIGLLFLGLGTGIWIFHQHASKASADTAKKDTEAAPAKDKDEEESSSDEKKVEPVAKIQTIPLKESSIDESAALYGTIVAASQMVKNYTVPFDCKIKQISVTLGQSVQAGDLLLEIEPSPEAKLDLQQAKNDLQFAMATFKKVQEKFDLKLVTRQDYIQAQQAVDQAKLKLNNLTQLGSETLRNIKATTPGIINQLDIQAGQSIQANSLLVAVANNNSIEAKLGVDPEHINQMHTGQPVWISLVNRPSAGEIKGSVRMITHKINTDTRLVDFYVSLPEKHNLLLSDYVTGRIITRSAKGFVVPRNAVLPGDNGNSLYTIKNGKAVLHNVQTGLENNLNIQVISKDLKAGDLVVIQGNYELQDGMDVDTTGLQ